MSVNNTINHHVPHVSCHFCGQRAFCFPAALPRQAIEAFDQLIERPLPFDAGEVIVQAGEPFRALLMARSGLIKQVANDTLARPKKLLDIYLPGEVVGLESIGDTRVATSFIAADKTFICRIPYGRLTLFGLRHQSVQKALLLKTARQLRQRQRRLELIYGCSAASRVARFLLDISARLKEHGKAADCFALPLSQIEIASYLDLAPETVNRHISRLKTCNVAVVANREVCIQSFSELMADARY